MAYRTRPDDRYTAIMVVMAIYLLMMIMIALAYVFVPQDKPTQHYYVEHTVQQGETLWDIATEFNAEDAGKLVWQIKAENGLINDVLMPGQKLLVPVPEVTD